MKKNGVVQIEELIIPDFTRNDFIATVEPYQFITAHSNNAFARNQLMLQIKEKAKNLGLEQDFKRLWKDYEAATRQKASNDGDIIDLDTTTQFPDQPISLNAPGYICTDTGVWSGSNPPTEIISHPLTITARLRNMETGEEKLKLAYYKGGVWRSLIADKYTLASTTQIISLAKSGIAVNSANANEVIKYLSSLEANNYDAIPEQISTSRLGWTDRLFRRFIPYDGSIVFDGDENFRQMFGSVHTSGDYDAWKTLVQKIRKGKIATRIALAASFASPLIAPIGALPFITHLWSVEAGTGKTVSLMVAASVWASPEENAYLQTMDGTKVSMEVMAGFVRNCPLILDELQLVQNKDKLENDVYMLAEGKGRSRGSKSGGLRDVKTWRNTTITSGESPITNYVSGAGAYNRVVEVECKGILFDDVQEVLDCIRANYGHAGKEFTEYLAKKDAITVAKGYYRDFYQKLLAYDTTAKQAMAGAILLTADALATIWIFRDDAALTVQDVADCLHTQSEIDTGQRAYQYISERVVANIGRFTGSDPGEQWGRMLPPKKVMIIRANFEKLCVEGKFSSRSVLSWLAQNNLIEVSKKANGKIEPTLSKRIGASVARCVIMKLPQEVDEKGGEYKVDKEGAESDSWTDELI